MLGGEIGPQLINRNSSCLIREGSVLSVKNLVLPSRLHSEAGGDGRRGGPADADHPPPSVEHGRELTYFYTNSPVSARSVSSVMTF